MAVKPGELPDGAAHSSRRGCRDQQRSPADLRSIQGAGRYRAACGLMRELKFQETDMRSLQIAARRIKMR